VKETPGYEGLSYQKLTEVPEQWPIVGREDLYYGGTGYKNEQGIGVQLAPLGGEVPADAMAPQMPDAKLVAVPVTSLYDRGTTVVPSTVLHPRIPHPFIVLNPKDAEAQKATDGMTVSVSVNGASATVMVQVDENIPAGFALLPRSMGISIVEPVAVEIKVAVVA
jgi:NADH-quinone oxidoreductase subunit G